MKTVNALNLDGLGEVANIRRARVAKRPPSSATLRAWITEVRGTPATERGGGWEELREEEDDEEDMATPLYTRTLIRIPLLAPDQSGAHSTGSGAGAALPGRTNTGGQDSGGGNALSSMTLAGTSPVTP